MSSSEHELVARAQKGDSKAFGALAEHYGPRLYSAVLLLVRNQQDAEDIVQEAFLKALRSLGSFRQEASFGTWLHRIAYNLAIDQSRKRREIPVTQVLEEKLSVDSGLQPNLERLELVQALAVLSPEVQVVMVLRHAQDLSIRQIADLLQIPTGTVKSRLYNGYRRLREELTRLGEEKR